MREVRGKQSFFEQSVNFLAFVNAQVAVVV